MPDELFVRNCAPTLAGIKTGSLFTCPFSSQREVSENIRAWNRRFVPRGLRVLSMRYSGTRALIYVYRPDFLKYDLSDEMASDLLRRKGYSSQNADHYVIELMHRLREYEEFPHEIGLFLGYPPVDVCGFIDNKACGYKCVGCWKVYGDEEAARKTFASYKQCTKDYCARWRQGTTIEQLIAAG